MHVMFYFVCFISSFIIAIKTLPTRFQPSFPLVPSLQSLYVQFEFEEIEIAAVYSGILGYCYLVELCPKACENVPKYRIFNTNNHILWEGSTVRFQIDLVTNRSVPPNEYQQVAQLSQSNRTTGLVSFGQKWKTIFCRQYRYIFNHFDVIGLRSYRIR